MLVLVCLAVIVALSIVFSMLAYAAGAVSLRSPHNIWRCAALFAAAHIAIGLAIFVVAVWAGKPRSQPVLSIFALILMLSTFRTLSGLRIGRAVAGFAITCSVLIASNFALFLVFFLFIGRSFVIAESSGAMMPTIAGGDRFLVDYHATPRRWDIIVYRSPMDPDSFHVSRLAGLPGETIELQGGKLSVNGQVSPNPPPIQNTPYVGVSPSGLPCFGCDGSPITLGPGEYFVLGDNSRAALDSRHWDVVAIGASQPGALPAESVIGVITFRYSPFNRFDWFH